MKQEKLQTSSQEELPPSTALQFVKSKKRPPDETVVSLDQGSKEATAKKAFEQQQPKQTPCRAEESVENVYVPLTSRVRRDIKRRLKRLSHYREDTGHEVRSVQMFLEAALIEWLEAQEEPGESRG